MRPRHLIGLILSQLALAGAASAEEGPGLSFEAIYDLPFVHSLEFGPGGGELLVAVEGMLLQWRLDPLRLVHHQDTQILANDMALGPDQKLYTVGLGWEQGGFSRASSKAISYMRNSRGVFDIHEVNTNLGISQYSSVAFTEAGKPILASASSFTASPFPTSGDFVNGEAAVYSQLKFTCGGATQLSIFQIGGVDHYVASTAGEAMLEFGRVNLGRERGTASDCFSVQQIEKGQQRAPTYDSLRHAVIDLDGGPFARAGVGKAVVVLDPNTNRLLMFRIEPYGDGYFLSRRDTLEVDLTGYMPESDRRVVMTDLAADARGRELHVASNSANVVIRFEFDGAELRWRGRLDMRAPVQGLEISDDGSAAAIVSGHEIFGGDWRIMVISNPAHLADWLQIPASFASIQNLQKTLNENGFDAGSPDGILGPQTTRAIEAFRQMAPEIRNPAVREDLESAIVSSFPGYILDPQAGATKN